MPEETLRISIQVGLKAGGEETEAWIARLNQLLNELPQNVSVRTTTNERLIGITDLAAFLEKEVSDRHSTARIIWAWLIKNRSQLDVICSDCRLRYSDAPTGCRCESRGQRVSGTWVYTSPSKYDPARQHDWLITAASLENLRNDAIAGPGIGLINARRCMAFLKHTRTP